MQEREDEDGEEEEDEEDAAADMEWKEADGNKKEKDDGWYPGNAPAKRAKKASKAASVVADDAGALSNQSAKIGLAIKGAKNAPVNSGGVPLRGKRAKEALVIAKRASSACNKKALQEAELPKIVPPFAGAAQVSDPAFSLHEARTCPCHKEAFCVARDGCPIRKSNDSRKVFLVRTGL